MKNQWQAFRHTLSRGYIGIVCAGLVASSGCTPGEATLLLNDIKHYYLNGGLSTLYTASPDEMTRQSPLTPFEEGYAEARLLDWCAADAPISAGAQGTNDPSTYGE